MHYLNTGLSVKELAEKVFGIDDPYAVHKAKDILDKWKNTRLTHEHYGLMNHHLRVREVANRLTRDLEAKGPSMLSFDTETVTKNGFPVIDDNVIVHYWDTEK
jgi:hypothetical protein